MSTTTMLRPPAALTGPADAGSARRRDGLGRLLIGAAACALLFLALLMHMPVLSLLALLASVTCFWLRTCPTDVAVVRAAVSLLFGGVLVGLAADALGVNALARPGVLGVAAGTLCLAIVADAWRRPSMPAPVRGASPLVHLPAVVCVAIALLQVQTSRAAAWAFATTDTAQHMTMLATVSRTGQLDYGQDAYPRALHMLLALVDGLTQSSGGTGGVVERDLALVASSTWLSAALFCLLTTAVTFRLCRALDSAPTTAAAAAVVLSGGWLVHNPFVLSFAYQGAGPSLIAAAVLLWLPLEFLARQQRRPRADVIVGLLSVTLLFHLWQPLALAPLLVVVVTHHRYWRGGGLRSIGGRTLALALACAAAVLPPTLGLLNAGGGDLAATPGSIPSPPLWLAVAAVLALLAPGHSGLRAVWAGQLVGVGVAVAYLLDGSGSLDLRQYYPQKALWFACLVGAPLAVASGVRLGTALLRWVVRQTARTGPAARTVRTSLVATTAAVVLVFIVPLTIFYRPAAWAVVHTPATNQSSARMALALEYGHRVAPALAVPVSVGSSPIFDSYASFIVSKILAVETGQAASHGRPWQVCQDVSRVAGDRAAVVLTAMDPVLLRDVMTQFGCADVPVVQVPGGTSDDELFWRRELANALEAAGKPVPERFQPQADPVQRR